MELKKGWFKNYLSNEFFRNVLTLMTGVVIAQFISIALSPVISRLYSPEDFGLIGTYTSIVGIAIFIAGGRFDLAIMLPKSKKSSLNILFLCFLIGLVFVIILLFIILLFSKSVFSLSPKLDLGIWIYIIPFSILLALLNSIFNNWNAREKKFEFLRNIKIFQTSLNSSLTLVLGFFKIGSGLIISNIATFFIVVIVFISNFIKGDKYIISKNFSKKLMVLNAKRYKNFPMFTSFSSAFNSISNIGIPLLIASFFSLKDAGLYFFANKMVSLPLSLIIGSFSNVYYQKASSLYNSDKRELFRFTRSVQKKLIMIVILPLLLISLFGPFIFRFVFGDAWETSGELIKYFVGLLFFRSIYSPISQIGDILGKQKFMLFFNISISISIILTLFFTHTIFEFKYCLMAYAIIGSIHFIFLNFYMFKKLKEA
jgi:O-antigen/teichoic acid export membrane protein